MTNEAIQEFDSLLKCFVCRELFKTPLKLECRHKFCSLCIRSLLQFQCPVCNETFSMSRLERDDLLHEIVEKWKDIKEGITDTFNSRKKQRVEVEVQPESINVDRMFIPSQPYDLMKIHQIRDKLQKYQLNTSGDKRTLIKRHKNWVAYYNANLDKPRKYQLSDDVLITEFKNNEIVSSKTIVSNLSQHYMKYKTEFDNMVLEIRNRK